MIELKDLVSAEERKILMCLGSAESASEHPIGKAIFDFCKVFIFVFFILSYFIFQISFYIPFYISFILYFIHVINTGEAKNRFPVSHRLHQRGGERLEVYSGG